MSKSKLFLALSIFCCFLFLTAPAIAQSAATIEKEITVTDDLDRELILTLPLESVISLAPSITEILCALDLCAELIGVDNLSNYPESAADLEKVTNMDMSINLEAIIKLDPELVIISELTPADQVELIAAQGITVYYLKNPKSLDEMGEYFMKIGELIGHEAEAEELSADWMEKLEKIDEQIKDISIRPAVFYEIDATDPAKPWTASSGTFIDQLITRAGGENIAANLVGEWVQISLEKLIQEDPDIIILGDSSYGVTLETLENRSGWESLTAVKEGNVFPVDSDMSSRPGPRLITVLEELVKILHPENQ